MGVVALMQSADCIRNGIFYPRKFFIHERHEKHENFLYYPFVKFVQFVSGIRVYRTTENPITALSASC